MLRVLAHSRQRLLLAGGAAVAAAAAVPALSEEAKPARLRITLTGQMADENTPRAGSAPRLLRAKTQDAASATFTTLFSSLCAKLGKPRVDQNTKASWPRRDQQFMWQTLVGERLMSRVAVWAPESLESAPASDSFAGAAKVDALVLLGDHLNGHVGVVHGGFTAALLDDLFGWAAGIERKRFDPETAVFTANLHVDYKRPMPGNGAYHVTVRADRVEKRKKIFLVAEVRDVQGQVCAEATSLYVAKARPPAAGSPNPAVDHTD